MKAEYIQRQSHSANASNKEQIGDCQDNPFERALVRTVEILRDAAGPKPNEELAGQVGTLFRLKAAKLQSRNVGFACLDLDDVVQECLGNFWRCLAPGKKFVERVAGLSEVECRRYVAGSVARSAKQRMLGLVANELRQRGYDREPDGMVRCGSEASEPGVNWWERLLDAARCRELGVSGLELTALDVEQALNGRSRSEMSSKLSLAIAECWEATGRAALAESLIRESRAHRSASKLNGTAERRAREARRRLQCDLER